MTLADLKGLIRVRNAFLNRTQLQFTLDLANHGNWPGEIDPSVATLTLFALGRPFREYWRL